MKSRFILLSFLMTFLAYAEVSQMKLEQPSVKPQNNSDEDLALKLQNPVANLISIPFQFNQEYGIGDSDPQGTKMTTNIQPVIPIDLTNNWLVINRIIAPVISQTNVMTSGTQNGLGDVLYTAFLSPRKTWNGITWGLGPAISLPTGTDNYLSSRKWSLGPSIVLLKQNGPWTIGGLANQIWSVGGDKDRDEVNSFFIQPFISYTTPKAISYNLVMEDTYNWKSDKWIWSLFTGVSKVFRSEGLPPMNIAAGPRFYAGPSATRPDFGFRLVFTMMFPE